MAFLARGSVLEGCQMRNTHFQTCVFVILTKIGKSGSQILAQKSAKKRSSKAGSNFKDCRLPGIDVGVRPLPYRSFARIPVRQVFFGRSPVFLHHLIGPCWAPVQWPGAAARLTGYRLCRRPPHDPMNRILDATRIGKILFHFSLSQ